MNRKGFLLALGLVIMALAVAAALPSPLQPMAQALLGSDSFGTGLLIAALPTIPLALGEQPIPAATILEQYNKMVKLDYYLRRNGVISTTVATLPLVAIATTASKVKTTNATVLKSAGVANALAASDDFWTLTGAAIANASGADQFVRYLLLVDSADAATVLRSSVAATKALCEFPALPADGLAIAGILTVEIDTGTTFTPGTSLLSDAGITDTYADGDQDDAVFALGGSVITR